MSAPAPGGADGAGPPRPRRRRAALLRRHGATVLLVLCLSVLAGTLLAGRSGIRLVTVDSGSMAPALPAGAVLVERHEPLAGLRTGAVITFHAPTPAPPLLTHRVVAVDHSGGRTVVRTRGDANPGPDPWEAQLLGDRVWVVVAAAPWGGRLVDAVRSPLGLTTVAVVLPGVFAVSALRSIWRRPDTPARDPRRRRAGRRSAALLAVVGGLAAGTGGPAPADAAFTARVSGGHAVSTVSLTPPSAVTLQDACPITGSAVDVSWTATGTTATGYRIERRTDPAPTWTPLTTVPAGDRTYRDSTVVTLIQYTYRVSAVRGSWSSTPAVSPFLVLTGTCSR
ncbi:signal peptidase I [Modestobacter sp. URMC 112]